MAKSGNAAMDSKDSFDRSYAASGLSRRTWLRLAASAGVLALSADPIDSLAWSATPPTAAKYPTPSEWTGHNRKLGEYFLAQGYPARLHSANTSTVWSVSDSA
jgi:hypothetical protein